MPILTHDAVIEAMRTVQEPELGRDLIALDMVKDLVIDGTVLSMTIELTTPACPLKDEIERTTNAALGAIGATKVDIAWGAMVRRSQPRQAEQHQADEQDNEPDARRPGLHLDGCTAHRVDGEIVLLTDLGLGHGYLHKQSAPRVRR